MKIKINRNESLTGSNPVNKITKQSSMGEVIDTVKESLMPELEDNIKWYNNAKKFRGVGTLSTFESNLGFTDLVACCFKIEEFNESFNDLTIEEIDKILDKFDKVSNDIFVGIIETTTNKPDCYYCLSTTDKQYKLLGLKSFNRSAKSSTIDYYSLYDWYKTKNYAEILKALLKLQRCYTIVKKKVEYSTIYKSKELAINPKSISKKTIAQAEKLVDRAIADGFIIDSNKESTCITMTMTGGDKNEESN